MHMTAALDPRLAEYLTTNRDFCAPVVAEAIAALDVPAGARVLDAGPGAGGALPLLAAAAGPGGSVLGVDLNAAAVPLAAAHAGAAAEVRAGDVLDVLGSERFDLVWASDVVWPGNFDDPGAAVAAMLAGVRPSGTVALLTSGYYRASFLPGYGRLELLVRAASFLRWRLPADGPHQHDRLLGWLLAAGAVDTAVRVLPRIGFPDEPAVRAYLTGTVWPEMRQSAAENGRDVGLTDADLADLAELTTPGGPRYVADEPGYHVVQPALLVTGRRAVA
jgi:SAM-dependent methyltransferase